MTGPALTTKPTRRRSFRSSGITYEKVARELGLRLCDGSPDNLAYNLATGEPMSHKTGHVTIHPWEDRAIHWSRAKATRRGLYRFLSLAAMLLYPDDTIRQERWLALYRQDRLARQLGERFRIRFPKEYGAREKARVRLDMNRITPLDREFPEQRDLIRRVKTWAKS